MFGIEHGNDANAAVVEEDEQPEDQLTAPQKRHIGAVYRSDSCPATATCAAQPEEPAGAMAGLGGVSVARDVTPGNLYE